jgi:hypothetical protein
MIAEAALEVLPQLLPIGVAGRLAPAGSFSVNPLALVQSEPLADQVKDLPFFALGESK